MVRKMGIRLTLLVEDEALERFGRQTAVKLGFHPREIRVLPYPVGRGSAKQWVEIQYPSETKLHRAKATFQNIAFLVGTDADEQTVQYRYGRLAQALQHSNLEPRGANERIVLWIPRWNIETWIVHLLGRDVNEDTDYKYQVETDDFEPATNEYVRQYRAFDPATCAALPSLKNSFAETQRLDP